MYPIHQNLNLTRMSINYAGSMVFNQIEPEIKSLNTLKKCKASLKKESQPSRWDNIGSFPSHRDSFLLMWAVGEHGSSLCRRASTITSVK